MEFARKSWGQIRDIYHTMSPSSRLTLLLLCGMVVLSLGYLLLAAEGGDTSYVLNGLEFSNLELAKAEQALDGQGLTDYDVRGSRIAAPKSLVHRYDAALAEQGAVPDSFGASFESKIDQINQGAGSSWESERTREYRRLKLLEMELARHLGWWSSIERAAVTINKKNGLSPWTRGSEVVASVSVRPASGAGFGRKQAGAIRQYLSKCVAGLTPKNISVVDTSHDRTFVASDNDMASSSEHLELKLGWERWYSQKLEGTLLRIAPGAVVGVNVSLEHSSQRTREVDVDGKDTATIYDRNLIREERSGSAARGGEPGTESNLNPMGPAELGGGPVARNHTSEESESEQKKVNSETIIETDSPPGDVKAITVAVAVPHDYYRKAYKAEKKADPDIAAEAWEGWKKQCNQALQNTVQQLIGEAPNRTVTVDSFPMIAEVPPPAELAPESADIGQLAGHYGQSIGLGLLALVSLFMVRNVIRKSAVSEEPGEQEPAPIREAAADGEDGALTGLEVDPDKLKAVKMTEQVQEMVKQNPDMAAALVKRWVGKEGSSHG